MAAGGQDSYLDPATLRERAAQCLKLATTLPSYANAETLKRIAGNYLEMAERLERAEHIEGRRPGNA
jgi:hypothetical protein